MNAKHGYFLLKKLLTFSSKNISTFIFDNNNRLNETLTDGALNNLDLIAK